MARWVEGIDYEMLEGGRVRCLHCNKTLESKAGLGPHLTACTKGEKRGRGLEEKAPSQEAPVPEEAEVLKDILVKFGMKEKRAEGVSMLLVHAGWNNFSELKYYCANCGMNPDRIRLVLQAWSNHRGQVIPLSVLSSLQYMTYPNQQAGEKPLTREEMLKLLEEREKRREREEKVEGVESRIKRLEGSGNPKTSEIQLLRDEIKEMRDSDLMKRLDRIERSSTASDPFVQVVKSVENTLRDLRSDIKPLRWYLLTGKLPDVYVDGKPAPKKVEPNAREGIFQRVNPKFVAEE